MEPKNSALQIIIFFIFLMISSFFSVSWSASQTFQENTLKKILASKHIIAWNPTEKYHLNFDIEANEFNTLSTCNIICSQTAIDAGAVRYKVFTNVSGFGDIYAYYDEHHNFLGIDEDSDSDGIINSQDNDTDNDGIEDAYDEFPEDPGRTSSEVITISGNLTVTPSGAASYNLPLEVPPGVSGLAPKLSLTYNSQSGNGSVGVGWSISGLSTIHRCPTTIAQDGYVDGVDFDNNDQFCLDGQRLKLIDGTHGIAGAEYRTEIDNNHRVIWNGTLNSANGSFTIHTPSGETMRYGSRSDSQIAAQGQNKDYIWALDTVRDGFDNIMTIHYSHTEAFSDYWPTEIRYAHNTSAVAQASVHFAYTDRNDTHLSYMGGSKVKRLKLLKKISTKANNSAVKEYVLNYETSHGSGRNRLKTIIDCSLISLKRCKQPITFNWQGQHKHAEITLMGYDVGNLGFEGRYWSIDVNGDGDEEIVYYKNGEQFYYIDGFGQNNAVAWGGGSINFHPGQFDLGDNTEVAKAYPMDVNGDGLMDLVVSTHYQVDAGLWAIINEGDGTTHTKLWGVKTLSIAGKGSEAWPVDINADGLMDLIYTPAIGGGSINDLLPSKHYYAMISQADGSQAQQVHLGQRRFNVGQSGQWFFDIDNDGLQDLMYNRDNTAEYYVVRNKGNGQLDFTDDDGTPAVSRAFTAGFGYAHWPMDVNGDGVIDLVYNAAGTNSYRALINTGGNQFLDQHFANRLFNVGLNGAHWVLDVNRDGMQDLLYSPDNTNAYYVMRSNADGSRTDEYWGQRHYTAEDRHDSADADGNGGTDLISRIKGGPHFFALQNKTLPDLMLSQVMVWESPSRLAMHHSAKRLTTKRPALVTITIH